MNLIGPFVSAPLVGNVIHQSISRNQTRAADFRDSTVVLMANVKVSGPRQPLVTVDLSPGQNGWLQFAAPDH
jgi:hypothetical protein